MPLRPIETFLEKPARDPFRLFIQAIFRGVTKIRTLDQAMEQMGLLPYPLGEDEGEGPYFFPRPSSSKRYARLGFTVEDRSGAEAFTISCAGCHAGSLFGRPVLGMTNRFPRANEVFVMGKSLTQRISSSLFQRVLKATPRETQIYEELREAAQYVGARKPQALGLDTSLAQVALSLAHRRADEWATKDPALAKTPRDEILSKVASDSKPMVWWNVKYKNRFLSDGSVVSGNPVYTNFLWNELGRGTDLHELGAWLEANAQVIRELTTAVFAAEAPHWTDYFPSHSISVERARRGQKIFERSCAGCHGIYEKNWENPDPIHALRTVTVRYPNPTPVKNVGTDPLRARGMISLAKGLNPLKISKENGVLIEPQEGYVPPPLVGIWARFPYFHNNSVPSLCDLLTVGESRPVTYWAGPSEDLDRDYDSDCVGYPTEKRVPPAWKKNPEYRFDTRLEGLSNRGHDDRILVQDGKERFTLEEKFELIEFLKTL
jgi:cytochrome c5